MNNGKIKSLFSKLKNGKTVTILGIVGILLIGLTSFIPEKEERVSASADTFSAEQYCLNLEKRVEEIIQNMTGETDVTVVVTLETGIKYAYAGATEESIAEKGDENSSDKQSDVKKEIIIVKTANGGQQALLITEYMPEIRGVTAVCKSAADENTALQIKKAVMAALGVSSSKVCIGVKK